MDRVLFQIEYSETKNIILKETRGICFEDVVEAINKDKVLADIRHPNNTKYPNQKIYVVEIKNYAYAVPYIIIKEKKQIFLKTVYPSRSLTKKYMKLYEK